MIIYNPHNEILLRKRLKEIEKILNSIEVKHCFVSGSFLFKEDFNDIDVFIISRTKKEIKVKDKRINIIRIDFNDLHSLFYHSVSKSCVSKNLLPKKPIKATITDYWNVINEAVPTIMNEKDKYHKDIRFLVLYTEFFKKNIVLDSFELTKRIEQFRDFKEILEYIRIEIPAIISKIIKKSYAKKYFYTQAGYYKDNLDYESQKYLYQLSHDIAKSAA